VVATAVGGIPEIIRPGENGEIVPPRNPKALGAALKAGLARSWSRQAVRQSVASRSWDKVAQEVVEVFRTVVADRR
jgi:glycosyltransferase involved in cell wall biosynthesis